MAIGKPTRDCTIVLHDDTLSKDDVLCGQNVLSTEEVGLLSAANARTLTIAPKSSTRNGDEISVHISIARRFSLENRTKGKIQVLEDENEAIATHVEITFRDQHLSRADLWRMKAQAEDRVAYKGQKLKYLGSTAAEVANVYIAGQEVDSAIISHPRTKLIFRSYSARYTILIQLSKEMLEHWRDGDLMYERLMGAFLPELFQRWAKSKLRHQVTVVIFGRGLQAGQNQNINAIPDEDARRPKDFYQVMVSEMRSTDWRLILRKLQEAFTTSKLPQHNTLAAEGNMLEAFHLAAMDFADDNLAPPASSTGTSIIAITAGAGMFEADHNLLKCTTELLLGNSIGVDVVSLSPKPLHPVPLFQYELEDKTEYALLHWLDISYWDSETQSPSNWLIPNCGEEVVNVFLPFQCDTTDRRLDADAMIAYDGDVFEEGSDILEKTLSQETTIDIGKPGGHTKTPSHDSGTSLKGVDRNDMLERTTTASSIRPSREDNLSAGSPTASKPLTNRAKREGLPPHPLMQNFRKISLGPKGLAPSQGVASTTVSAHHVQQARDPQPTSNPVTNENPSLLARQIRDTLRRRPSQRTLSSQQIHEPAESSRPIVIRTSEELPSGRESIQNKSDPASLIEKAVMGRESGPDSISYSATPKGKRGSLRITGLSSIDARDGSTTPWLTLLNPCNPKRENMRIASEYRKWQSVFPRAVSSGAFKWDSMCSPASLPLMTEVRVSMTDLERHFDKRVRRLLVTALEGDASDRAQHVVHQLVTLRLTAGFQIVPTRKLRREQTADDHIEKIILSLGSHYHELKHLSPAEIQITEYERSRETVDEAKPAASDEPYKARVKSLLSSKSQTVSIAFSSNPLAEDWSVLDDQCANPIAAAEEQGVCQMRFVLIPVQTSQSERSTLSDEERRIDGIQKLTLMWQRNRFLTSGDEQHHASMEKPKGTKIERDPNPLAIEYQTRDPSAVVSGLGSTLSGPRPGADENAALFPESETYHSSNFDITKLVKHMQEPPPSGVELRDRRWFTRLHFKCFRGDEMCNWIMHVFKDLESREEAVALGNQLMERDIFTHVRGKHEFRDGHYLYQIKGAYRTTDYPDNAGLFSKGIGRSMPSTPMAELKQSPNIRATQGESDSSSKGTTPNSAPVGKQEKKTVLLTEKLRYNVDPNKKSEQLEVVNLHYDRIHNPENCYHIQLDWTNTTPKLVRESVARWASVVEAHSLKLMQLPMKEVCKLHLQHPLDQAVPIRLALRPPKKVPATPLLDPHGVAPPSAAASTDDPVGYHKALLRNMDFVLDLEAANSFPKNVAVAYSWGKPDFQLTQFVHKSGLLLAQIACSTDAQNHSPGSSDKGPDFLLLQNRLAPQPTIGTSNKKTDTLDLDAIVKKFKSFCQDEQALRSFYSELSRTKPDLTSPFAQATRAADGDVPPMELPELLGKKGRG